MIDNNNDDDEEGTSHELTQEATATTKRNRKRTRAGKPVLAVCSGYVGRGPELLQMLNKKHTRTTKNTTRAHCFFSSHYNNVRRRCLRSPASHLTAFTFVDGRPFPWRMLHSPCKGFPFVRALTFDLRTLLLLASLLGSDSSPLGRSIDTSQLIFLGRRKIDRRYRRTSLQFFDRAKISDNRYRRAR